MNNDNSNDKKKRTPPDHSPLPWRQRLNLLNPGGREAKWGVVISPQKGNSVVAKLAKPLGDEAAQLANAEFIVRACNAHYELLEALRYVSKYPLAMAQNEGFAAEVRALISKALGK